MRSWEQLPWLLRKSTSTLSTTISTLCFKTYSIVFLLKLSGIRAGFAPLWTRHLFQTLSGLKCLLPEAVWTQCCVRAPPWTQFLFQKLSIDSNFFLKKLSGHGTEVESLLGLNSCFRSCLVSRLKCIFTEAVWTRCWCRAPPWTPRTPSASPSPVHRRTNTWRTTSGNPFSLPFFQLVLLTFWIFGF